jgi:hypothetical protein
MGCAASKTYLRTQTTNNTSKSATVSTSGSIYLRDSDGTIYLRNEYGIPIPLSGSEYNKSGKNKSGDSAKSDRESNGRLCNAWYHGSKLQALTAVASHKK